MKNKTILLFLLVACIACKNLETAPPNVVIIIGDDITWNDIGCYGNNAVKTPNIDKLAANGLRFDNAYLTISSCSPSRISIMTGRYPHNTGAPELHIPMPNDQIPFPLLMKQAGYYTAAAGKWHLSGRAYHTPGGIIAEAFDRIGGAAWDNGGPGGEERWVEWLRDRPMDKPFCMWFASHDAHRGWDRKNVVPPHRPEDVIIPPYLADMEITRNDLAAYYDEIARLDFYTGKVVEELENQGILDNTIVIVMADNGRDFPRCKTRLYDDGIKTPFIVHYPKGIKQPGKTVPGLISSIDIAPTILEISGIEIPESIQGLSFAKVLKRANAQIRDYVFAEHNWHDYMAHERMVRHKNMVYIRNSCPECIQTFIDYPARRDLYTLKKEGSLTKAQKNIFIHPNPEEELYDLTTDSYQINNLVGHKRYSEKLNSLRKTLDKWIQETGDTRPDNLTPDERGPEGTVSPFWLNDHSVYSSDNDRGKIIYENRRKGKPNIYRGTLPGEERNASKIHRKGPY